MCPKHQPSAGPWWLGLCLASCQATEGTLIEFQDAAPALAMAAADATPKPSDGPWVPAPGSSYQIQLTGALDDSVNADVYIVDVEETDPSDLSALKAQGRHVLCYFSAGSHEPWRADADQFPPESLGNPLDDYPSERWLDPNSDAVRAAMAARIEQAQQKGCDGVEPALVTAIPPDSGFSLSRDEQLDYASFLEERAHGHNLSIMFAGANDYVASVAPSFDAALTVGCLQGDSCLVFQEFSALGKSVLMVEIGDGSDLERVCGEARRLGFSGLIKSSDFGAFGLPCP